MILHTLRVLGEERRATMLDEARRARLFRLHDDTRSPRTHPARRRLAQASLALGYTLIHWGVELDPPED